LEARLAEYHEVGFVSLCSSGTFAIEIGLRALGVGPGDEVLLAAYDYPGNFLAVHAVNAMPVLLDVDPANWNLDLSRLDEAITASVRALIVSHLHGGLVPMREVMKIALAKGIKVIEDAAQAPGAICQERQAGTWGDIGVLSFGGSKLLTAGRGGALLTDDATLYQRMRTFTHRGNQISPLSELQAAVLLPQLDKLDERNRLRAANVQYLRQKLRPALGLRPLINPRPNSEPAYYKLGFQFDTLAAGLSRERFLQAMRAEGIALDEGFQALHVGRSPKRYRATGGLDQATEAHEGIILLHHPVLLGDRSDIDQIVSATEKVVANAKELAH
jgi:dTDP-4-amino-4,6-dideoxygalactose transaminase